MRYLLPLAAIAVSACGVTTRTPQLVGAESPPAITRGSDTLKVHMKSGSLYMLSMWRVDSTERAVLGVGTSFDLLRVATPAPDARIPLDSVALFETNAPGAAWPLGMQGVAVLTTLGAYVSAVCLADPKSCFGSCPTFYLDGDEPHRVHAEGFSASVASVLEERDVDAMPMANLRGRRVAVVMKNEAWETHVVREVNLLVAPKPRAGRVFATPDSRFVAASALHAPTWCSAEEGSCLESLRALDRVERRSAADSTDLAARESVELTFPKPSGQAGIVLTARNSLITTFLFYQSMGYVGRGMGAMVASFERGGREFAEGHFGMARLLGGIEVEVRVGDRWLPAGTFGEPGPIAADTKVIPLPATSDDSVRVRLRMARGNWRLDWVALASLGDPVQITRVSPARVEREGRADAGALRKLRDMQQPLVTMPGDEYRISYELPAPAEEMEVFLESRGYYYEWQRSEWLGEEDAMLAAMVVMNPAELLRRLAPVYKRGEARMEELFWESRYNAGSRGGKHASR